MRHLVRPLIAILLAGCLMLGYLVLHERTVSFQALSRLRTEQLELQRELAAAKAAKDLAEREPIRLMKEKSATAQPLEPNPRPPDNVLSTADILKTHPEYAQIVAKSTRRMIYLSYREGLKMLNLPPEKQARLIDLMADLQTATVDMQHALESSGLKPGSTAAEEARTNAFAPIKQQIAALLGVDGAKAWDQLQSSIGMYGATSGMVDQQLSPDFLLAGVPLSEEQAAALKQTWFNVNTDPATRPHNESSEPDSLTGLSPQENRMLGAAAQVLSPAQVQVIKEYFTDTHNMAAIYKDFTKNGMPPMIRQ